MDPFSVADGLYESYRSGTYVTLKITAKVRPNSLDGNRTFAVIGVAEGGKPGQPYVIRNQKEAEDVFRGGELLEHIKLGLRPSSDQNIRPQSIVAVNVLPGTQGVASFKDNVNAEVFSLKTLTYRERSGQVNYTLSGSATAGFTFNLIDNDTGAQLNQSNLGLAFSLAYTGAQDAAVAATGATGVSVPVAALTSPIASGAVLTFTAPAASVTAGTGSTATSVVVGALSRSIVTGTSLTFVNPANTSQIAVVALTATADKNAVALTVASGGAAVLSGWVAQVAFSSTQVTTSAPVAVSAVAIPVVSGGTAVLAGFSADVKRVVTAQVVTQLGAKRVQITVPTLPGQNLDIAVNATMLVRDLLALINRTGVFQAISLRDSSLAANVLDVMGAAVDANTGTPAVFTATKGDLAYFFQTRGVDVVEYADGVSTLAPVATTGNFLGGVSGVLTPTNWSTGLNALFAYNFSSIVAVTVDEGVQTAVSATVTERNSAARGQFTQIFRPYDDALLPVDSSSTAVNAYLSGVRQKTATLNDAATQLAISTGTISDPSTGLLRRAKLTEVAVMLAGLAAGYGPNVSLTYKTINLSRPFPELDLIRSNEAVRIGAVAFEVAGIGGPTRIIDDRTTFVGSSDAIRESGQGIRVVYAIARGFKALQETYIPGQSASVQQLASFRDAGDRYYANFEERGWITQGRDPVTGVQLPAYTFTVLPTTQQGRVVRSIASINPTLEFKIGDHELNASPVEIEV